MIKAQLGWVILVFSFMAITIIDQTIYKGVWPSTLPIGLLVAHALYFRKDTKQKRRLPYWLFILLFFSILYFSLPKFTYQQAKEIVLKKYEIIDEKIPIVPVKGTGYHPFALTHFYSFKVKSKDTDLRVMVNPDKGKVIILN
ncbi:MULTISPECIES: PepSY domain-containing protein [unclassified Mesobacillus]|uniref:PepSY domain-containing protein n=1 Tax=unclassified Mesobacillus TaxID=2675270 RepID=UPI00204010C4|nr:MULTISPECIES: PepSY domain-containing protein [unclassified Mesobacillus]MCM3124292.1 PepSY domain-containing protein [Mesobacillus sp. MER 33]MCM3234998.1 PepSY domain-containing protein [Mesobacillus sp. MER 48]